MPRLADVAECIRARMERLGDFDLASQDVLIEIVRELEKQLWMLRASLSGDVLEVVGAARVRGRRRPTSLRARV